jgi:nucleoid-associated protein YgaU
MYPETPKTTPIRRLKQWVKAHPRKAYAIVGVAVLVVAGATAFAINTQRPAPVVKAPVAKPAPKPAPEVKYYSPLTGSQVADEAATKMATTAIMIENSPDARPQSGLKQSGVVYEAVAEGGITRFLTVHQQDKPQLIGPVRSLRMYYVDWLAPFNASVAHVGGSANALTEVRNGTYRDIDQFFNPATYWRAPDRYAPHNVYTSFEKLDALNQAKGYTESKFTGFSRIDGKPSDAPNATSIAVTISGPTYNSSYVWDAASNTYPRSQAGAPHLDREDGQIAPSSVVVMKVNMVRVLEDGYRESITTTGSGEAIIFQNGTVQTVTWNKADRASQITFTDAAGKDVPLVRGQTWISAVPNGTGGVTWQ